MPELHINKKGLGENTALTFAAGQGHTEIVLTLLRSGADPGSVNSSGKRSYLGCQTSDSASSSNFHHLALLVALVSHSSNFHH